MIAAPCVLVHGTWGAKHDWIRQGSDFRQMLIDGGIDQLDEEDPFQWSGNLDGVTRRNAEWDAWGKALSWYVRDRWAARSSSRFRPVSVVSHSHAGNLVAYAVAKWGLAVDVVVTVATPVRADLTEEYRQMARVARRWIHIASDETSGWGWQALGEFSLRHPFRWLFPMREMPEATTNIYEPGYSHSDLVAEPYLWLPEAEAGYGWRDLAFKSP